MPVNTRLLASVAVLALALLAVPARAAGLAVNLASNPGFDSNTTGWAATGSGTLVWSNLDAAASAFSGSALFTNTSASTGFDLAGFDQCVNLPLPVGTVGVSTNVRIPSGQAQTGSVFLQVNFYSATGCSGYITNTGTGSVVAADDTWHALSATGVPVPGGAQSVFIIPVVTKNGAGTFQAYFDDVAFVPLTTPVTLQRFDAQ